MTRTILFLCPHAAAKSVMAAAYCERLAGERGMALRTDAAGTEPDAEPMPSVVALLAAERIDVSAHRPRRVGARDLERAWRVVSVGCDVGALACVDLAIEHWDDVPAPSKDLLGARDLILARVRALLDEIKDEEAFERRAC